jgi:two-component system sensor histidine kinase UhpB
LYRRKFVYEAVNPAFRSVLGIAPKDVREVDLCECLEEEDARSISEVFQACLDEGAEVRVQQRLSFGGTAQNVETMVSPISDSATGGIVRLIGGHRRLSESGGFHETAPETSAEMDVRLLSMQEGIQQRIASDLHDSTCQHLIAASLSVMRIRAILGDRAKAESVCDEIDASIDQALRETRAFTYLLYPQDLTAIGLKATIEQYASGFSARTSLKVTADISSEVDRLPYDKQRSVLRIVQEALTNIFRHAKATKVEIEARSTGGYFHLRIGDDGIGMPVGRTRARAMGSGVGIPAMRARLHQLGGALEIQSGPEVGCRGTILRAVFPSEIVRPTERRTKTRLRH